MHPAAVAILQHADTEDLDCRPAAGSDSVLDSPGPTRTSNFSVIGHYTCYRRVFSASERDPYIGRTLEDEVNEAKRVAMGVKRHLDGQEFQPIAINVSGIDDVKLQEMISAIYRNELSNALGPGHVLRNALPEDAEASAPLLDVRVLRLEAVDKMTQATLKIGKREWQDL